MKRLVIYTIIALSFAGCTSIERTYEWATTSKTTAAEANTVAAASNLYLAAARAADAYVKNVKPSQAIRDEIAQLSSSTRADLDDALDQQQAGNSAKVTLALDAFNQAYPAFVAYLGSKGVKP